MRGPERQIFPCRVEKAEKTTFHAGEGLKRKKAVFFLKLEIVLICFWPALFAFVSRCNVHIGWHRIDDP